jgi:glycosyltransferase involved in cell wall biosynthesis
VPASAKKTVLHVIPSLRQGGAEKILSTVVTRLMDGYRHHIVTLLDDAPFFDIGDAALETVRMDRSRPELAAVGRLRRAVDRAGPDLIHTWMYHANFLSACLIGRKIPILWSIHNTNLSKTHTRRRTRWINVASAALSRVVPARIVYCASSARDAHEAMGYASAKSCVIENGVDTAGLFPDAELRRVSRRALAMEDADFVVCSLARFDPQKDHATLLDALARVRASVPRLRVLLVGSGCEPQNHVLVDALRRAGLTECAQLLGERRDINAILNASDLLAVSSAFGEALPLAIIEAAMVGLPIVSTAVGDIEDLDLVDAIVPTQEPGEIARAVVEFAAKPYPAEASAQKRCLAESRFSAGRMLAAYDATYRGLLIGDE